MEDCGAEEGLPKNVYLRPFKGVISHKPELVILVYDHTGEFKDDKNYSLTHNNFGFLHELLIEDVTGKFYLGKRRKDIELHNAITREEVQRRRIANDPDLPCPKEWIDLLSVALEPPIIPPSPPSPSSASRQSTDSAEEKDSGLRTQEIPDQLKSSPINTTHPTMTSTQIATAMTNAFSFNPRPRANSGPGPGPFGGNPGGNPGGPGGGNPGGGGGPGNPFPGGFLAGGGAPQSRTTGALPLIFNGDRTKARLFIRALTSYLRLNERVPPLNTYKGRMAFAMTLIQGEKVDSFIQEQAEVYDQAYEAPQTWNNFLDAFERRFLDTQRDTKARQKLEYLKLKGIDVDTYVQDFTALARDAGYDVREPSVWRIYLKGLPESVGMEVWRYPVPQTFPELVAKTLSVVKEKGTHNDIWGRTQRNWGNQRSQQDRTTGNRPSFSNNQRFNSSNAPRSFNDQPVDMDLSRTRANRKGQWTRTTKTEDEESKVQLANLEAAEPKNKFKGICYNCGQEGHPARLCRRPKKTRARTANTSEGASLIDWEEPTAPSTYDPVQSALSTIAVLSAEEKQALICHMNEAGEQDFQTV